VLYAGPLYGQTVVTRHVVREGGVAHDYLLLFGHLDQVGDDVRRGRRMHDGASVGFVGNSGSPALVHLHLEARRVRDGVDVWTLGADALHAREYSVVSDPRNLLPLRFPREHVGRCTLHPSRHVRRYWLGEAMTLAVP
jgi:murein DD-endopeptidase MepM/ murein hydrolase activator NlpD